MSVQILGISISKNMCFKLSLNKDFIYVIGYMALNDFKVVRTDELVTLSYLISCASEYTSRFILSTTILLWVLSNR